MGKKLLLLIICMSTLFSDLIHPPDQASLNYIHVKFRWGTEMGINEFQFQLTNANDALLIDSLVTDTFLIIKDEIEWFSTYHWKVYPINGGWSSSYSFSTKGNSASMFTDVDAVYIDPSIYNPELSLDGITIYGIMDPYYSAAIDIEGKEIWNSNQYMFINVKDNKEFFANSTFGNETQKEFGVQFTFENDIIWHEPRIDENLNFLQHELIKLPNGNYMGLVPLFFDHYVPHSSNYPELAEFDPPYHFYFEDYFGGSAQFPCEWKTEKIVEWDSLGNEIWSWLPNNPDYGFNLNDFDEFNYWSEPQKNICIIDPFEWTHFNALAYDNTDSSVYVSSKNLSRITKINYNTKEIIWNLGANLRWWEDLDLNHIIFGNSGQHGLQILPNGNLVTFDNGIGGQTNLSTALEIKISNVGEIYNVDTAWSYILPEALYGTLSGNVQKLPNDNYLITTIGRSDGAHTIEVTPDKQIVWSCNYNVGLPMGKIYRAMRIPGLYENEFINSDSNMNISNNVNPNNFNITSIYPNPFNPSVNIEFEQSELSVISANIYNLNGQLIEHLFSGFNNIGSHNIIWNASDYPSGIYFIQLTNQSWSLSQKLMLIK